MSRKTEFTALQRAFFAGKRILVTGAGGYLASNLVSRLIDLECAIIRVSRRAAGASADGGAVAILDVQGDIQNPLLWEGLLERVDVVYHLAAQTSVPIAEQDPVTDWRCNVLPMLNLLETCRKKRWRPMIVFSGTATEVGIPEHLLVNEQPRDVPVTVYDLHKLWAEQYLIHYARQDIVGGCTLRLSNVYGPGPKSSSGDRGIINQMMSRAIVGEDLTVYGTGECLRDYVYVDDVVEAFLRAPVCRDGVNGRYFVIGSGEGHSIAEAIGMIAERVAARTSRCVAVKHVKPPMLQSAIESRNFIADTARYKAATGWQGRYSLAEGIDRTLDAMLNTCRRS
jgi:UDP-glucose 4-epimerase